MPRETKLADVESKLKERYGNTRRGQNITFGTLNKIGLMHGNKPTKKGLQPAKKK